MAKTTRLLYLIPVLTKALDILELLQSEKQPMSLEAIHRETKISKTTVYRVLKTFIHRGYLVQGPDGLYRQVSRAKKLRFGYASQSSDMPFSNQVTDSLKEAAVALGVDLLILDNRYDAETALLNAEEFVRAAVDLVIEFQVEQHIAPMIADKIAAANIPLIAIDIPHPHATFFGVDNYRSGFEAGECLAAYAVANWQSKINWVIGLDLPEAGRGVRDRSRQLIFEFLQRHPNDRHILIAAVADTSALGALDAVRELHREDHVAIVGQDCIPEALAEIRSPASPFLGSVSHETASYGPSLMHLGLAILRGQTVPPYNYVAHKVVTRE